VPWFVILLYRKAALIFGWMIFAYVAYETSKVQIDFTEFDPYMELGIDRVSIGFCLHWFIDYLLYYSLLACCCVASGHLSVFVRHM